MKERNTEIAILLGFALLLLLTKALNLPDRALSFLILFSVASEGYVLGKRWIRDQGLGTSFVWGTLGSLAILMLIRGAWFYLGFNLNNWGEVMPVIITMILGATWVLLDKRDVEVRATGYGLRADDHPTRYWLLATGSAILSLLALVLISYAALRSGTSESIRTPWPLMPSWTLPLIGLQWIFALATAWKLKNKLVSAIQVGAAIASTSFITPLLYKIGYGFDGFLHIAGERVLLETGTLLPKPAYYMGQYVLTTWISKIFEFDVSVVDPWLVPIMAAILIPAAMMLVIKGKEQTSWLPALILMPFAAFVATTPHGFATVLAVTALILCMPRVPSEALAKDGYSLLALPFALWSALTHPLVGLPILLVTLMAIVHSWKIGRAQRGAMNRAPTVLMWIFAFMAGISVPFVFGLATWIGSSAGVSFDLANLFRLESWQSITSSWIPWVGNRYAIWPEASVWIEKLLPWITIVFAILAVVRSKKEKTSNAPWIIAAASTAFAAIILSTAGDFDFLIDYERGNYADRLWMVAWLMLLPLAIPELGKRLEKAKNASGASLIGLFAAIGILAAGMTYAALPRHDAATASRGWSVGRADIEAVRLIDEDSEGRDYTVLANQSVSAAAVRTYGFKRYNKDVFFYPIPTGGKLYDIFLHASYEDPSVETMVFAGQLGGSDLVYLVVNDYWWDADELIQKARVTANRAFEIQEGKAYVFRYDLLNPVSIPESEE
jgi:hypothetical protein